MREALKKFSSEQRSLSPHHHIDPGFINKRKCFSIFGPVYSSTFYERKRKGEDHWAKLFNDHLLVELALQFTKEIKAKTFGEIFDSAQIGDLVCSTEKLEGAGDKFSKKNTRVRKKILFPYETDKDVFLEFSTEHFVSDTGRIEQVKPNIFSIIGQVREISDNAIIVNPLIMGAPSLDHKLNSDLGIDHLLCFGFVWNELLPEDIDEFSSIKDSIEPKPEEWKNCMMNIPEKEIKEKFCELIGDTPKKDWGGEQHDHYTAHIHLNGNRKSGAFLFKGPSAFEEMKPRHLGKNADQIVRLASSTADILIVQHCHDIGESVRETLRRFAVVPHNPRQYCFIDGRSTYKIFRDYKKL